jgi:hypothetical protein
MSSRQPAIPRPARPGATRAGRAPLGAKPAEASATKPAAAPASSAAAEAPKTRKPATKSGGSKPRPKGTQRLVVDVPDEVADAFKERARSMRFSQPAALTGALQLLAELDDEAYEKLLLSTRR